MKKVVINNIIVTISKRIIKLKSKITSFEDFKILTNIKGGKVTYKAYWVKILEELLSKNLVAWKKVPKNIIAKNGNVMDNTVYIDLNRSSYVSLCYCSN